jgi:hypothetical protein
MGTSVTILTNIFKKCLGSDPDGPRSYLDIGSQQLFGGTPEQYREFMAYCLGADALGPEHEAACRDLSERSYGTHPRQAFCVELFDLVRWDYQSLDMYNATIKADLNTFELGPKHVGHFDFVANFGTTEHVFDQRQCFQTIHSAARVGGNILHFLPSSGFLYHCLFSYNPKTFLLLAQANKYEIVHAAIYGQGSTSTVDQRHETWAEYGNATNLRLDDVLCEFIFRKTSDTPFQLPYDVVGNDYSIQQKFARPCASVR